MKRLLALILALMFVLAACSSGTDSGSTDSGTTDSGTTDSGTTDAGTTDEGADTTIDGLVPDEEQFINYSLYSDPKILDTTQTNTITDLVVVANTVVSLTRLQKDDDGSLKPMPYGAASWTKSDDGLVYTFNLADVVWEDGVPVTAQHYMDAFLRVLDPAIASPSAEMLNPIKNAEAYRLGEVGVEEFGVKIINDKTIEITLGELVPYFMDMTYNPVYSPIRLDVMEQHGSTYGTEPDTLIACGAFKVEEWVHDSHVKLVKNPTYFETDQSLLEEINFKIIKDSNAIMAELFSGTIDRSSVSVKEWREKFIEQGDHNYGDYVLAGTYILIPNTTWTDENGVALLSNAKIRQALSSALNRAEVADIVAGGLAVPAEGFVPSIITVDGQNYRTTTGYSAVEAHISADPKALFIEGLTELGVDPDPTKYTIDYLVRSTTATSKDQAEYFYEVFKSAIGVELEIRQVESAVGREITMAGDYGMTYTTYYSDYNDPNALLSSWISSSTNSYNTGWTNAAYDEAMAKANSSTSTEERLELFKEAERVFIEQDCAIIPVYHPMSSMMTAKYVQGFEAEASGFAPTLFATVWTSGR